MNAGVEAHSIDANVIIRYLVGDNEALYEKASQILYAVESGAVTVICDPVNLGEVVWVLRSSYKLTNEQICEGLEPILSLDAFKMPEKERYVLALKLFANEVRHFGDACACAAALQDCDGRVYSFDAKLSGVKGILRSELAGR